MRQRSGGIAPSPYDDEADIMPHDIDEGGPPRRFPSNDEEAARRPRGSQGAVLRERFINRNKALAAIDRSERVSSNYNHLFGQLIFASLVFLILLLQRDVPVVHKVENAVAGNLEKVSYNGISWTPGKGRITGMTEPDDIWGYMTELALLFLSDSKPYITNVSQLVCCLHIEASGTNGVATVDIPRLSNATAIIQVMNQMRLSTGISISGKNHHVAMDAVMVTTSVKVLSIIHTKAVVRQGGWIDSLLQYRSFRSRLYRSAGDVMRALLEVVYFFITSYVTYRSVRVLYSAYQDHQRGEHQALFWPILDFMTCLTHIILIILWLAIATNVLIDNPQSTQVIVEDVRKIFTLYDAYYVATFILTLLLIVKMFQFADKESKFGSFFHTIKSSFVDIIHFLMVLTMLLIFFTVLGNYLFGEKLSEYRTFLASFQSNVGIILGEFGDLRDKFTDQGELVDQRWLPHFYFWVFIVVMNFVLLNMFIAIVLDAYANMAKRNGTLMWNDVRDGLMLRWQYFRRRVLRRSTPNFLFPSELRDALSRCDSRITLSQLKHQVCLGNEALAEKLMNKYADDPWGQSTRCDTCGEYKGGGHHSTRASAFGEMDALKKLRMVDDATPIAGSWEDLIRSHFTGGGGAAAVLTPQEGGRRASVFFLPTSDFEGHSGDSGDHSSGVYRGREQARSRGGRGDGGNGSGGSPSSGIGRNVSFVDDHRPSMEDSRSHDDHTEMSAMSMSDGSTFRSDDASSYFENY